MTPDESAKYVANKYAGQLDGVVSPEFEKRLVELIGPLEVTPYPIGRTLATPHTFRHIPRWRKPLAKLWLRVRMWLAHTF